MLARLAPLAAALTLSACATMAPQVTVERELMMVDQAFSAMSASQGMSAAFMAYMDPAEGMMIRPGGMATGVHQLNAMFADTPREIGLTWTPDKAYASASGDFGMTTGRFVRTAAGRETGQGRYVTVWRRNREGQWKALLDIGNSDPATAEADPAYTAPAPLTPSAPLYTPPAEPATPGTEPRF